jgi:hypothetical protein
LNGLNDLHNKLEIGIKTTPDKVFAQHKINRSLSQTLSNEGIVKVDNYGDYYWSVPVRPNVKMAERLINEHYNKYHRVKKTTNKQKDLFANKVTTRKRYTKKELKYIQDNFRELGFKSIADKLGRTETAIMRVVYKKGLHKKKQKNKNVVVQQRTNTIQEQKTNNKIQLKPKRTFSFLWGMIKFNY